ncbi:hypothetical protein [Hungatella hathewayi]|uniref:hypothetical protein n=1 Tax=Hungatella hathewayi TaxID=154046 RepID=UPI003563E707
MIKIRQSVFETNSSSIHSLSLAKDGFEKCNIPIKRKKIDGKFRRFLVVKLSRFGKDYHVYTEQSEKFSYLVTLSYLLDGGYDVENMQQSYAYKRMEEEICKYCKCDGIMVDDMSLDDAEIDHQTITDYSSISDFIYNMGVDYVTFVFNKHAELKTDSD